jgi:hypothetical protein
MKRAAMWPKLSENRLRARNVRAGAVVVIAVTATALAFMVYAAAASFAAPWLAQHVLERIARSAGGGTAQFSAARFNPFTLTLSIESPSIAVVNPSASYTAEEVRIDFAALTLLQARPALDSLAIAAPRIEIDAHVLGAATDPSAWQRAFAGASIKRVAVERAWLVVRASGAAPRVWVLDDTTIRGESLDLRASRGDFAITVGELLGSTLEIEGVLSAGALQGRVAIRNVDLERLAQHVALGAGAAAGVLELAAQFSARAPNRSTTLQLTSGEVAARGVTLAVADGVSIDAPLIDAVVDATLSLADGVASTGTFAVTNGALTLLDRRAAPEARFHLTGGRAAWTSTPGAQSQIDIDASAALADGGSASYAVEPVSQSEKARRVLVRFVDVPAPVLDAYASRALDAEVTGGRIDAAFELAPIGATRQGRAEVTARELVLGDRGSPAIEMGLALLEDPAGTIALAVPIVIEDAVTSPPAAIAAALVERIAALGAAPHDALGSLVNRDGESLRTVEFMPGAAAPPALGVDALAALGNALAMRPKVGVDIAPVHDPELDRRALAIQQVELHVLLATAGPTMRARPEPVDFASARAQDVLDEFADERLPAEEVATIASLFDLQASAAADGAERTGYYRAIFDALVAREPIPDSALQRLGRFRAQATADVLGAQGVAPHRIMIGAAAVQRTPEAHSVIVPLELTSLFDAARRTVDVASVNGSPTPRSITRHDCVEGWSCIGRWTGPP